MNKTKICKQNYKKQAGIKHSTKFKTQKTLNIKSQYLNYNNIGAFKELKE